MDKTISITLGGLLFNFTEDAYAALSSYIDKLKTNLANKYGAEEICEDIENRIAELCQAILEEEKKNVIFLKDIESILAQMGDPDEFIDEDERDEKDTSHQAEEKNKKAKKLFRDSENTYIGGVCSGIAAYLNIDPIIVRVIFLIAFFGFGTGLLVYIILWIAIPETKNASDRLKMKGENVTLKNIQESIQKKASEMNTDKNWKKLSSFVYQVTKAAVKVFLIFIGITLLFFGIIGIISLVTFFFAGSTIHLFGNHQLFAMPIKWSQLFFVSSFDQTFANIVFIAGTLAPLLLIMALGIQFIFHKKSTVLKYFYLSLFGIWILAIGGAFYSAVIGGHYFNVSQASSKTIPYTANSDTLYVESQPIDGVKLKITVNDDEVVDNDNYVLRIKDNRFEISNTKVNILPSPDSLVHIKVISKAYGRTDKEALKHAKSIDYAIEEKGNNLVFPRFIAFPTKDKFRAQSVKTNIYLPEGKVIYFNSNMKSLLDDVEDKVKLWDDDMTNHYWTIKNGALNCLDCSGFHREE